MVNLVGNAIKFTKKGGISIRITRVGVRMIAQPAYRNRGFWHRHSGRRHRQAFFQFYSGRRFDLAPLWRHRARARYLSQNRSDHGRPDRRRKRTGQGQYLLVRNRDTACRPHGRKRRSRRHHHHDHAGPAYIRSDQTGAQLRILVVDDVAVNRFVVEKMLENLGYQVETATNGGMKRLPRWRRDTTIWYSWIYKCRKWTGSMQPDTFASPRITRTTVSDRRYHRQHPGKRSRSLHRSRNERFHVQALRQKRAGHPARALLPGQPWDRARPVRFFFAEIFDERIAQQPDAVRYQSARRIDCIHARHWRRMRTPEWAPVRSIQMTATGSVR